MGGRGGNPQSKGGGKKEGANWERKVKNPQYFLVLQEKRGGNGYGRGGNREYKIQSTKPLCPHPLLLMYFGVITDYCSTKQMCQKTFQGGVSPTNFKGSIEVRL